MNGLDKRFINAITGKSVFLLGVIFLISYIFMNTIFVFWFKNISNQNIYIESMIFYNSENLYSLIKDYGEMGRNSYIKYSLIFDFIFPLICSLFFISFTIYLFRKINLNYFWRKIVYIVGIIFFLLDWIENIFLIIILYKYPQKLLLLSNTVSPITVAKSLLSTVFLGIIIFGIIILFAIYIKKVKRKIIMSVAIILITVIGVLSVLLYIGVIWFNNPSSKEYPIRGVDVSAYQGTMDWDIISSQDINFAFIKATEGSSFKDPRFLYNWENAKQTSLMVGAYHFFSYDSSGETQADNFIRTVPISKDSLPPVVDIEFYGDNKKNPPDIKTTQKELNILLDKLELHYNQKPIIYATQKSYSLYIQNYYDTYPIWIRNVITKPHLPDNRDWIFWQYSHRERLRGYKGEEKFIDMNVFHGTQEEFDKLF